jgi:hypothetical protein
VLGSQVNQKQQYLLPPIFPVEKTNAIKKRHQIAYFPDGELSKEYDEASTEK